MWRVSPGRGTSANDASCSAPSPIGAQKRGIPRASRGACHPAGVETKTNGVVPSLTST